MEHKFKIGDLVSFNRNFLINSESTPIIALLTNVGKTVNSGRKEISPTYIIEHESGWVPNDLRASQFGLDITKKYLFVSESELTLITD